MSFYRYLVENHQETVTKIISELESLLITNGYEYGADTQVRLRRIINTLKKMLSELAV